MNSVQQKPLFQASPEFLEAFDKQKPAMAKLPKYIWMMIFSYLDNTRDLASLSRTCKHWYVITAENAVWKSLISKFWPHLSLTEFTEPKAFIRDQFQLAPRLFFKKYFQKQMHFFPSESGILTIQKPLPPKNEILFWEDRDDSFFSYKNGLQSLILKKKSGIGERKKCDYLDLSFTLKGLTKCSVKEIKIFGDHFIFHVDYISIHVPIITYSGGYIFEEEVEGSVLILVNKSHLSLIGCVHSDTERISHYELAENGDLRIFKMIKPEKFTSEVYRSEKESSCCTIL